MSSFLFNFEVSEEDEGYVVGQESTHQSKSKSNDAVHHGTDCPDRKAILSKEVKDFCSNEVLSKFPTITVVCGEHNLEAVDTSSLEKFIKEDESLKKFADSKNLAGALSSHSDLITGVYEGGLKIWECGIDMVEFLSANEIGQSIEVKGKRILEVGCGAGLPGVYCCKYGAQTVDFQDYNEEVLQLLTHSNVVKNASSTLSRQSRYFSGDWASFTDLLQTNNLLYDIIISAETIYNPDNYPSLHNVFNSVLSEDGVVIISAKVYYFGVGGSVEAFTDYVHKKKCFSIESVHDISAGVPRKILLLRRLQKLPT